MEPFGILHYTVNHLYEPHEIEDKPYCVTVYIVYGFLKRTYRPILYYIIVILNHPNVYNLSTHRPLALKVLYVPLDRVAHTTL